ncbi:MAG: hypothetical protein H7067_01340 [Burkholderiales bacterium]|nr:hypothetical protein [Opitutaceae bacterium]
MNSHPKRRFLAALPLLFGCAFASAQTTLISDDFSTSGLVNATAPDVTVAAANWLALTGANGASSSGTVLSVPTAAVQTASVDLGASYFSTHPGIYTLTCDLRFPTNAGGGTNWIALGFATSALATSNFTSGGAPWILYRENGNVRVFTGPGTGGSAFNEGTYAYANGTSRTFKLVLNTAVTNWTLDAYVGATPLDLNGGSAGNTYAFSTNPAVRYVGLSTTSGSGTPVASADNFQLSVAAALPAPTLVTPAHNNQAYQMSPSFYWNAVAGAASYEIQISTASTFATLEDTDTIEIARYVPEDALAIGNKYWRVRAIAPGGLAGAWSSTFIYQLLTPATTYTVSNVAGWQNTLRTWVANNSGPLKISFPTGTYQLVPAAYPADFTMLSLVNRTDIVIEGNNSTIVLGTGSVPTGKHLIPGLISLTNCQRITVRRLTIEHDVPPHFVGVVQAITNPSGTITKVRLLKQSGYPDLDGALMQSHWEGASILDPSPANKGRLKPNAGSLYYFDKASVANLGGGVFEVNAATQHPFATFTSQVAVNDAVILYARAGYSSNTVLQNNTTDTVYEKLNIYTSGWGHFWTFYGSDLKVLGCNLVPKNSTRWFAGNADGIHARAHLNGPWVEGCTVQSIGDDGVALYNKGMSIIQHFRPANSNRVRIFPGNMHLVVGDTFKIFNAAAGTVDPTTYSVTATAANGSSPVTSYDVDFTPALTYDPNIVGTATNDLRSDDQLFCYNKRNAGFVIRDNQFLGNRRYGTVVRAANGIIKNNTYSGSSAAAIAVINEANYFQNGLNSSNLLISGNTLNYNGFDTLAPKMANLHVEFWKPDARVGYDFEHLVPTTAPHSGITVVGNTISNWEHIAILLGNATASDVASNTVNTLRSPQLFGSVTDQAIVVNNTVDCDVSDNNLAGSGVSTANALVIPGPPPIAKGNTNLTQSGNVLP